MTILAFLLLICPGILVWKICVDWPGCENPPVLRTLLTILLDDLLIFLGSYLILYAIYGRIEVSFSRQYYEQISTSLYSISFVWKYGGVSCVCAAGLGLVKTLFAKRMRKGKVVRGT